MLLKASARVLLVALTFARIIRLPQTALTGESTRLELARSE